MSDGYILAIACVIGMTLSSIFKSIFYYKHEANRQIKLAEYGFDPRKEQQ